MSFPDNTDLVSNLIVGAAIYSIMQSTTIQHLPHYTTRSYKLSILKRDVVSHFYTQVRPHYTTRSYKLSILEKGCGVSLLHTSETTIARKVMYLSRDAILWELQGYRFADFLLHWMILKIKLKYKRDISKGRVFFNHRKVHWL